MKPSIYAHVGISSRDSSLVITQIILSSYHNIATKMITRSTSKGLPKLVELVNPEVKLKNVSFKRKFMEHLTQEHKLLSIPTVAPRNVAHVGGDRSYVILSSLAKLERALSKWAMNELISKHKFAPMVVPNIVYDNIIERCGFPTKSLRSQVYKISGNDVDSILDGSSPRADNDNRTHSCLAGTSEFTLASIHIGDSIPSYDLPKRYCALSRCYRAETSSVSSEWGVYRVHYFNKVEMVGLTMPGKSAEMHEEFLQIQRDLFSQLGLHFQILDMPEDDLGLSAKKKYDIEAWMDGRQRYGEVSSTSNCEDYQSSRLNIKYSQMVENDGQLQVDEGYLHTVNGTACSSMRTLIALVEQHQREDGRIDIPKVLVPYMNGITCLPTSDDEVLLKEVDIYPKVE